MEIHILTMLALSSILIEGKSAPDESDCESVLLRRTEFPEEKLPTDHVIISSDLKSFL